MSPAVGGLVFQGLVPGSFVSCGVPEGRRQSVPLPPLAAARLQGDKDVHSSTASLVTFNLVELGQGYVGGPSSIVLVSFLTTEVQECLLAH